MKKIKRGIEMENNETKINLIINKKDFFTVHLFSFMF